MQYKDGTINVIHGSTSITGINTKFLTRVSANNLLIVENDTHVYTISSVTTDTTLSLTEVYAGTSKASTPYIIVTDFTPTYNLPLIKKGDDNWPLVYSQALETLDTLLYNSNTTQTIRHLHLVPPSVGGMGTALNGLFYYTGANFRVYIDGSWHSLVLEAV